MHFSGQNGHNHHQLGGQISSELFNSQFITHRKGTGVSQRKNTSDSNVKLLADHNFYHVTNSSNPRRYNNNNSSHHNQFNESSLSIENNGNGNGSGYMGCNGGGGSVNDSTTMVNSSQTGGQFACNGGGIVTHQSAKFKDMIKMAQKSYELSDYFKYNSKFKQRGLNSSSNSLISLNSSRYCDPLKNN